MSFAVPPNIDREIVKALRGRRSQATLSRMLGYTFNQIYLWETGRRKIHWSDFSALCKVLNRPLDELIVQFFQTQRRLPINKVLSLSLGTKKQKDIAKELKIS